MGRTNRVRCSVALCDNLTRTNSGICTKHTAPPFLRETVEEPEYSRIIVDVPIEWQSPPGRELRWGRPPKIMVVPDTQIRPGVDIEHLAWAGRYAAEKRPDVIVIIGDWWDMPSLSSYDKGKRSFEGRRYKADIEAGIRGMELFMSPIRAAAGYAPEIHFTEGNHEQRVKRVTQNNAEFEGLLGPEDFHLYDFGIIYHPFLEVVKIFDVEFSHYFTTGQSSDKSGNPRAITSAASLLRERMGSAVMGHNQLTDLAFHKKTRHIGLMAGAFYTHEEDYLGPQGNNYRRQVWMLYEVENETFDPLSVSINYLRRRYS